MRDAINGAMPWLWVAVVAGCPSTSPPRGPNLEARLAAEQGCTGTQPIGAVPVPTMAAPASTFLGFRDGAGFHRATFVCDLPEQIIAVDARQGVENGKLRTDGNVWLIPRAGVQASTAVIAPFAIARGSEGCRKDLLGCHYETEASSVTRIDTHSPQWVETSAWIHGVEDLCRALPDDTFATCSTQTRLVYVELGCPGDATPLQLGIHESASGARSYDIDVEVPTARLLGAVDPASAGTSWTYRFAGGGRMASLAFDLGDKPSATLELDGTREDCIAFGLYRR